MDKEEIFVTDHSTISIFGAGSYKRAGTVLSERNCTRALIVYDPNMKALGITEKIISEINAANIEVTEFGEVHPDPTSEIIDLAGELGRKAGADCVVGVGGGSSLDSAKGANLLLSNKGSISDYIGVNRGKMTIEKRYPLVLLPTTAGTSAEVTPVFVVTESATGLKTGAINRADVAIVDPSFGLGMPPHVTAVTGIDMLSHVTESLTNPKQQWLSDMMNENVIRLIFKYLPVAYKNPNNLEARTQLAFACLTAGYAFADKGTHIGHAVADRISNRFGHAHGVGCALGLLVALRYSAVCYPDKINKIASAIGLEPSLDERERGRRVVDEYRKLMRALGLKCMRDMRVDMDLVDFIAGDMPNDIRFRNNPYAPDYDLVARVLREEFESD